MILDFPYQEIREIFLNPKIVEIREIELTEPDIDDLILLLCTDHDFNLERVKKALKRLEKAVLKIKDASQQKTMTEFFS